MISVFPSAIRGSSNRGLLTSYFPEPAQPDCSERASNCVKRGSSCYQVVRTCSGPRCDPFTRAGSSAIQGRICLFGKGSCSKRESSCPARAEACSETTDASCDMNPGRCDVKARCGKIQTDLVRLPLRLSRSCCPNSAQPRPRRGVPLRAHGTASANRMR